MNIRQRRDAFSQLGNYLRNLHRVNEVSSNRKTAIAVANLQKTVEKASLYNGWFIKEFVFRALQTLGESLVAENLEKWLEVYDVDQLENKQTKIIGVVMAGNIPVVGFHDFLTVLISGNKILAKLSSDDNKLMPAIAQLLTAIEPEFEPYIEFTDGFLKNFDAIIATGSNNTARYFDFYFGKYPNIIRKNRNGVAILTGDETETQMQALADDIFLYFGLGCRNVAKLFVPKTYDFSALLKVLSENKIVVDNYKYFNNYEYNKAIYLINMRRHFDTGNLLLTEDVAFASPVSVVYYEFYDDKQALRKRLLANSEAIQCVVSQLGIIDGELPFGSSQQPKVWDYADGVDTLKLLFSL